jgi:hypothetical protein
VTPHLILAIALAGFLTIVTFRYFALCWIKPFRTCRKCEGRGRLTTPFGRLTRQCRRCRGTGHRLRLGRHVINHYRRIHADATRPPTATQRETERQAVRTGAPWR